MGLLDRYIARLYLLNTLLLLVILGGFVVTIDVSLNISRFVRQATELASLNAPNEDPSDLRVSMLTVFLVADLWWPRLLQLFNFMLGLVLVGAMGFTCAQLVRNRELVAALAGGQSLVRMSRPVFVIALGLTGVQILNQELVLPRIAPLLTRDPGDAGRHSLDASAVPLTADSLGRVWYAMAFDPDAELLENVSIWERRPDGGADRRIDAPVARWRDGGWDLEGGVARSRVDRAAPEVPVDRVETNLDPIELKVRRYAGYSQSLSWTQIGQMIRVYDELGGDDTTTRQAQDRLERIRWGRISAMLCNLLALAITMPFFMTRLPGNLVARSLKAAPVAVLALLGGVVGATAAIPGVAPAVSAFLPALALLPVAIAMVASVKT
jgi:lipopolysaccharide export system permease protein